MSILSTSVLTSGVGVNGVDSACGVETPDGSPLAGTEPPVPEGDNDPAVPSGLITTGVSLPLPSFGGAIGSTFGSVFQVWTVVFILSPTCGSFILKLASRAVSFLILVIASLSFI